MTEDHGNLGEEFGNQVCRAVYDAFKKLPKKGKPQLNKEWTLLSAVVSFHKLPGSSEGEIKVLSLGTGSKCISKSKMSPKGDVLNDSHAEIQARRAFLVFLYKELTKAYRKNNSEFFSSPTKENDFQCSVKQGISFHLFISHTPCGDASIFPKATSTKSCHGKKEVCTPQCKPAVQVTDETATDSLLPPLNKIPEKFEANENQGTVENQETPTHIVQTDHRKRKRNSDPDEEADHIGAICMKSCKFETPENDHGNSSTSGNSV